MASSNRFHLLAGGEMELATKASQFRDAFEVADRTYVDIVDILEFSIHKFLPDFRLMVRRDIELAVPAETTIDPPRIFVKESIYDAACEGDAESRRILAHELGHLLLHHKIHSPMQMDFRGYAPQFANMNLLDSSEDQADVFARHLLIPPHVAFAHRWNSEELARITGTPKNIAAAAITISKRQEMLKLRAPKPTMAAHVNDGR